MSASHHSLGQMAPSRSFSLTPGRSAVDSGSTAAKPAQMYVRVDAQLLDEDAETELLSADFIKKYIQYAKTTSAPQMSEAAATKISQAYATLRGKVEEYRTLPVTARTLEMGETALHLPSQTLVCATTPNCCSRPIATLCGACRAADAH